MKKIFLALVILSLSIFTTGCLKNYKTVSEYSAAMDEVKNKLGDYTIEATLSDNGREVSIKSYTKTNNKWKTEISEDNGNSYNAGILYDGNEILSYDITTNMAMPIPFLNAFSAKKMGNNEMAKSIMKLMNPVGILFDWDFEEFGGNIDKDWKFGKITKKNKIQCRMISSIIDSQNEVCVSDKYGIAVYASFYNKRKNSTVIINVKDIKNSAIDDSIMNLPQGIKKIKFEDMLRDLTNSMKNVENSRN